MSAWTKDELTKIGRAEEVRIASLRSDCKLSHPVTIWAVPVGDSLYVRSVNGRDSHWFRGTQQRHQGRISAGGVDEEVTFEEVDDQMNHEVDAAYRAKYRGYTGSILNSVLTPKARAATIKLVPRSTRS